VSSSIVFVLRNPVFINDLCPIGMHQKVIRFLVLSTPFIEIRTLFCWILTELWSMSNGWSHWKI
jgi:hypothetical protein